MYSTSRGLVDIDDSLSKADINMSVRCDGLIYQATNKHELSTTAVPVNYTASNRMITRWLLNTHRSLDGGQTSLSASPWLGHPAYRKKDSLHLLSFSFSLAVFAARRR